MTPAPETTVAVTMPQLGETVAEGTVLRWLKQVGDTVDDQEPLLEIATDKVDTEVPSPGAGVLLEIVVGEDTTVAVGTVLAHLGPGHGPVGQPTTTDGPSTRAGHDRAPMPLPQAPPIEASTRVASSPMSAEPADDMSPSGPRHRHSPRVRRLTREAGLDPDTLEGTGPNGRVTPHDVERAARTDEVARPATPSPTLAPSAAAAGPAGGAASPAVGAATGREVAAPGSVRSLRTVMVSADLTSLLRTAEGVGRGASPDDALVAVVTTQAVGAIRACPGLLGPQEGDEHVVVLVRRASAERTREVMVEHAEELNADGILRRLLGAGTRSSVPTGSRAAAGATLQFCEDDHVVVDIEDPGPGQVASIGFSHPSPHVVVVDQDGAAGIGIRQTAYVSVRFDQARLDAAVVRAFLSDLVDRLASA